MSETFEEMIARYKRKFKRFMAARRQGADAEPKEEFICISLGLGDPHHDPLREDYKGTKARVSEAVKLMKKLVPKRRWYLIWDEDARLVAPATKAGVERLKDLGAFGEDELNWQGPTIGNYNLSAFVTDVYEKTSFKPIEAKNFDGILSAAFDDEA